MNFLNALFFGIIQGLTEFFPVSSSAHLSVIGNLFGLVSSQYNFRMFSVFVHFGTVLALLITYWDDLLDMVYELILMFTASSNPQYKRERYPSARLLLMLAVATLPLVLVISLNSYIDRLYSSNIYIGVALFLTGCVLFLSGKFSGCRKTEKNITILDALIIGICQAVSSIPGLSRVGITATAGLANGLSPEFALKFAFLLSIPSSLGGNLIHLIDASNAGFAWSEVPMCLVGMAASMLTGLFSIKVMKAVAKRGAFEGFSYYCWVVGILFIILTMIF